MRGIKAGYFVSAMLLVLVLMFAGCDLFGTTTDEPQTYAPLIIKGKDSQNRDIEVEFSTTRTVKASVTSARAAAQVVDPQSGDSYKIRLNSNLVSGGTIQVDKPKITFTSSSDYGSNTFTGTWGGGKDLVLDSVPITGGEIKDFYSSDTKVKMPVASPSLGNVSALTNVTLTCETKSAEIWFTTDGSEPTSSTGTKYTEAIQVTYDKGKVFNLKAKAYRGNITPSETMSHPYSNPVATPTANTTSSSVPNNTTVILSTSTVGAQINYTYTTNGDDPPDPTYDNTGFDTGVVSGKSNNSPNIVITFTEGKPFKIRAMAIKDGYTNSEILPLNYTQQTSNGSDAITNNFGAGAKPYTVGINGLGNTSITITGDVSLTGNIVIPAKTTLQIDDEASLTVPAGKTITIKGTGAILDIQGGGTLTVSSGGKTVVGSGGKLTIGAEQTIQALGGTGTVDKDGLLEGSGSVIVESGGQMYFPSLETQTASGTFNNRFTLANVSGEIRVEAGGELFMVGYDTDSKVYYPWVGTSTTKNFDEKAVGADIVLSSGYITINPYKKTISTSPGPGIDIYLPLMTLYGNATVLGPIAFDGSNKQKDDRGVVLINAMFNLNGNTLTVGNGQKPITELQINANSQYTPQYDGKIIKGSGGKIIVSNGSKLKGNDNDIIGGGDVLDSDNNPITPKSGYWEGKPIK